MKRIAKIQCPRSHYFTGDLPARRCPECGQTTLSGPGQAESETVRQSEMLYERYRKAGDGYEYCVLPAGQKPVESDWKPYTRDVPLIVSKAP